MPTDFRPVTAVTQFDHLPEDIRDDFIVWARLGLKPSDIQQKLMKKKFTATRTRIEQWCKDAPGIEIKKVKDLPEEVKVFVLEAYRDRKPKAELREHCAKHGLKVNDIIIDAWFNELLRERQGKELEGELSSDGTSLIEEFEVKGLTWMLDKILDKLTNADLTELKISTTADFERFAGIVLRAASVSINRRAQQAKETTMLNKARAELRTEVQRRLVGKPEVVAALFEVIDGATETAKRNVEAQGR